MVLVSPRLGFILSINVRSTLPCLSIDCYDLYPINIDVARVMMSVIIHTCKGELITARSKLYLRSDLCPIFPGRCPEENEPLIQYTVNHNTQLSLGCKTVIRKAVGISDYK